MSSPPIEEKIALAGGVEAAITDDLLAIVGQDIAAVPADLPQYAAGVRKLDFSFNQLRCDALLCRVRAHSHAHACALVLQTN